MSELRALALFGSLLLGCGTDGDGVASTGLPHGDAELGGAVISTVNGHPITVAEVTAAARLGGVSPEVALRRLEDELLLSLAADRAGLRQPREALRTRRQARVQHLLATDIEAVVGPNAVDDDPIGQAELTQELDRLRRPERRAAVHLSLVVPADAVPDDVATAERWIREQWQILAGADDAESAILAYRRRTFTNLPFEVLVEDVRPIARANEGEPVYLAELFRAPEAGLLSEPFRSGGNLVIMVVTEILPAHEPTEDEARETIEARRLSDARAAAVSQLITEAVTRSPVSLEAAGTQLVLHDPSLREGGS